ncbi:MAG: efflux RND transporter permease subunit, partial [Nitrospinota bacterium]
MHALISWFARNSVAANILMITILFLGIYTVSNRSILEVFPEFESDVINISIPYRGATPTEVEEGVVVRVEESVYDLVGIEEIRASAREGSASISIEVVDGYNPREMLDDIKNRVDAISTFPEEIERPTFSIAQRRREVISVVVSGEVPEHDLRKLGEKVRDDIVALKGITQVDLTEVRRYEISIEIPHHTLQKYQVTFDQISEAIKKSSLDLPAGSIKTSGGEISLRTKGQAYTKKDFEDIVILRFEDGRRLTLGQIAKVEDGFEEDPLAARFNNKPCAVIGVYRVGKQNAIDLADSVRNYVETVSLPPGIEITYWRDRSVIIKNRLNTLLKSAAQGGVLVFLILFLFLRFTVAIWVCAGIPVAFTGAIFVLPELGVTINIVSLFAFILVLGIVVDDAIVTGENIYTNLKNSKDPTGSAIRGTQEISIPVVFGVLTTIAAFVPLMLMGGRRGDIFAQIPMVIIPVLLFSLVESKLILPAHLKHMKVRNSENRNFLLRLQGKVSSGLEYFVLNFYKPLLGAALNHRYITLSLFTGVVIITYSLVVSGNIRFIFFPRVQSELARATLEMPKGTPFETTSLHVQRIGEAAQKLKDRYFDPAVGESVIKNILMISGSSAGGGTQSHLGRVRFEIVPPEARKTEVT